MTEFEACRTCGCEFPSPGDGSMAGVCPRCAASFALAGATANAPTQIDAEPLPLSVGAQFRGMEVVRVLGRGGMGVVYEARQEGLDRRVAMKVLSPKLAGDPQFVARFEREGKALASLDHGNIVRVYDYGREHDLCYLVMEYAEGASLREVLRGGGLRPAEALRIVPQICDALEYAHGRGVVHRDIKPENILLDKGGRVKIADFGLAKMAGGVGGGTLTRTMEAMGTPQYMAPEQYERMKEVDHRADIYSLGVVFYEMLTGDVPMGRFDPPSRRVEVDVRLDEVVLKALERDPDRRYQRAMHVKTDVETVLASPGGPELKRRTSKVATTALAAGILLHGALSALGVLGINTFVPIEGHLESRLGAWGAAGMIAMLAGLFVLALSTGFVALLRAMRRSAGGRWRAYLALILAGVSTVFVMPFEPWRLLSPILSLAVLIPGALLAWKAEPRPSARLSRLALWTFLLTSVGYVAQHVGLTTGLTGNQIAAILINIVGGCSLLSALVLSIVSVIVVRMSAGKLSGMALAVMPLLLYAFSFPLGGAHLAGDMLFEPVRPPLPAGQPGGPNLEWAALTRSELPEGAAPKIGWTPEGRPDVRRGIWRRTQELGSANLGTDVVFAIDHTQITGMWIGRVDPGGVFICLFEMKNPGAALGLAERLSGRTEFEASGERTVGSQGKLFYLVQRADAGADVERIHDEAVRRLRDKLGLR